MIFFTTSWKPEEKKMKTENSKNNNKLRAESLSPSSALQFEHIPRNEFVLFTLQSVPLVIECSLYLENYTTIADIFFSSPSFLGECQWEKEISGYNSAE